MSQGITHVTLTQQQDYQFRIEFEGSMPALISDEPAPLGGGTGPSPVQMLSAAVGNCLSDSLLFALRKFKQTPDPIRTEVTSEVGRNADGRMRVLNMTAALHLGVPAAQLGHLGRGLRPFEALCTVTQSVGQCIPITVQVFDA